jgi:hypothetical protein
MRTGKESGYDIVVAKVFSLLRALVSFFMYLLVCVSIEVKSIAVIRREGPYDCETSRLKDFLARLSAVNAGPPLSPGKDSGKRSC